MPPEPLPADESVGVYIHVPFCERICPYCDFAVVASGRAGLDPARARAYADAVCAELATRCGDFAGLRLASIYLGGGTPALLPAAAVARLVAAVREAFDAGGGEPEVTLEANPSTLERERLPAFREAGVNRLSLGIQSFDDAVLKRLGRAHRAPAGRAALGAAREAGFANLSLDLIVAVPGEAVATAVADLDEAAAWRPEHVSAYALSVEPGTPYARGVANGRLRLPRESDALRMLEAVPRRLAAADLVPYELSSLSRPGFESVHNRRYWERQPVLGLGLGAWSTEPRRPEAPHGARRRNVAGLEAYLARVAAGRSAAAGPPEVLAPATARGEAVFLALRTRRGLDAGGFAAEFGGPPRAFFAEAIERLGEQELLEEGPGGDLRLTGRGRMLSDSVFEAFVEGAD